MSKLKVVKSIILIVLLLTLVACNAQLEEEEPTHVPVENEDVNENTGDEEKGFITVDRIEVYENMEISDWLDENTVIVSKENESLEKMKLAELSDLYPRSLYTYNTSSNEYKLLKEDENIFLGGAVLSKDKKHLLYYGYTLGDPSYYVLNLETLEAFNLTGAYSAQWGDDGVVVGASYNGGAYEARPSGVITPLGDFENEPLFIVRKSNNKLYYNTNADTALMVLDLLSNQHNSLNINDVVDVIPSPSGEQLLILQNDGSIERLVLCDDEGGNVQIIAETEALGGVSWSSDETMIVYNREDALAKGVYVYNLQTNKEVNIGPDKVTPVIHWSPSGDKLVYMEADRDINKSSIVYFE